MSEEDWYCGCHGPGAAVLADNVYIPERGDVLFHGVVDCVAALQGWHDCHGCNPEVWN